MYHVKISNDDNLIVIIDADKVTVYDTTLAVVFYKKESLVAMFKNPYYFYEVKNV